MAAALKRKLGASVLRGVGSPVAKLTKVAMRPGASGWESQVHALGRDEVEVLLMGDGPEWETIQYVPNAVAEGRKKALILLGHRNSEEAGTGSCAHELWGLVQDVPVVFIPAGDAMRAAKRCPRRHSPQWTSPGGRVECDRDVARHVRIPAGGAERFGADAAAVFATA